jgi:hypothetical protein
MSTTEKLSDVQRRQGIADTARRTKDGEGKSIRLDLRIYFNSDGSYTVKAPGLGDGVMARNDERLHAQLIEIVSLVEH